MSEAISPSRWGDDLLEAFDRLGVGGGALALAIGDEVVRHLGEAGDEGPQVLLGRARRRRRGGPPGLPEAGDHGGVDAVGLLQGAHRLGKAPHVAGIDEAAGLAGLPEQEEGEPLVAAARLHHDEPGALGSAEGAERGDAGRVVAKPLRGPARLDMSVEPILRNVHSTDDLVHGNLPCACDWWKPSDCSVVRDSGEDPRLTHGCCRRGYGRHRQASGWMAIQPEAPSLPSHKIVPVQIQGGGAG
jgi:hypothetical protein